MSYAYDGADRRWQMVVTPTGGAAVRYSYRYDRANRMSIICQRRRLPAYTIVPSAETGNSFSADNEMTSFGGTTLTYDNDGQLLSTPPDTYHWDVRRHLTSISGSDSASFVGACPE